MLEDSPDEEDDHRLVLNTSPQPVVSIVIPVYNELSITRRCLESLNRARSTTPFEVIVIDDASTDQACPAFLHSIDGITVLENDRNLGYTKTVNRAARHAAGEFIFLLNNDTVVTDYCIDELVRTFRGGDAIGAVGSKLIFPTGVVQEAGSFVWNDGSCHNFGHGLPPGASDYEFVRDVDYSSAAALMVRTGVWRDAGGFDERFAPAYYEDADLAFELRNRGHRVVYQPRSTVIHTGGASHGRGAGSKAAHQQAINQSEFVRKWSSELAAHRAPSVVRYALPTVGRRYIMVVDEHVPVENRDSGALRMWHMIEVLVAAGHDVVFVPTSGHPIEPGSSLLRDRGVDVEDGIRSLRKVIEVRASELDLVIASRPQVATRAFPIVRRSAPGVPLVYDMVDFHSVRQTLGALKTGRPLSPWEKRLERWEREAIEQADHVITITDDESKAVKAFRPGTTTTTITNVHEVPVSEALFGDRSGLLFVGGWSHEPNRDAVAWLLNEIMPAVWQRDSAMKLNLVGSGLPRSVGRGDPRVINHGWVRSLDKLFDEAAVSVAPLRYGAGMKGKVGDSLARGVPVIATPIAAEGFAMSGAGFGTVETVDEIAEAIAVLTQDPKLWQDSRIAGLRFVDEQLRATNVSDRLESMVNSLCPG